VAPAGSTTQFAKTDSAPSSVDSPGKSSVPTTGGSPNGTAATSKSLSEQITDLYDAADDPAQGAKTLATVSQLERNAQTGLEFAYAGIVRAKVAAAKGDNVGACTALTKAFPKAGADGQAKLRARTGPGGLADCKLPE
jgi:hypothetical protein